MNERMRRAAVAALHNCLAVQPGERMAILTGEGTGWARELLLLAAEEADAVVVPGASGANVIFCLLTVVPDDVHAAVGSGARLAHMPDLKPETMTRAMFVDYKATAVRARHVASLLEAASEAQVLGNGVELVMPLSGSAAADTGILRAPGSWGQLPGGEARRGRLGVGCNDKAIIWGDPLEDRKARGSVTVDGIPIHGATLLLDGVALVESGVLKTM